MKIFCIGRNYTEHINELGNEKPDAPVVFMKPETALIKNNAPFYYPDFSSEIRYETEIVLRIGKQGKHIQSKFAHNYFDKIGVGIDFTAADLQKQLKDKKLPWEKAKSFDGSAPVSSFIEKNKFENLNALSFKLQLNDEIVQNGNTNMMLYDFDQIIAHISEYFTLKQGDLIFTGTPAGVGPIKIGDKLEAFIENKKMLHVEIK